MLPPTQGITVNTAGNSKIVHDKMIPFSVVNNISNSFRLSFKRTAELNSKELNCAILPLRIQSEFRKIQSRKTPSTDTFHAVIILA